MTSPTTLPLSRLRIVRCAVLLADRDGLEAASLRKVAAALGVHVTSLHHHVPTKEALLDGLVEELFATANLPTGDLAWEQWVREYVEAITGLAAQHPGAFAVLLRRPVQGPLAAATFEAGLAAFHRAGMPVPESYAAVKSVALGVLGCCVERAFHASGALLSTDVEVLPLRDFPVLHQVSTATAEVDVVQSLADLLVAGLAHRFATS